MQNTVNTSGIVLEQLKSEKNATSRSLRSGKIVDLCFHDINYSVPNQGSKTERRVILNSISGICPGGQVTAIMGSSGAGKTSLLNVLACRITNNEVASLSGRLTANGQEYDYDKFATFASYVMQNDVLLETMTPREAFTFVANFKYADQQIREKRIEDTIKTMKLERCQHSFIGGVQMKGISGGERKRTSIGFELVSNPSCILLDEPTSGLDSFTAFYIINQLRQLAANQDRTIVFTIHQPSSDIFLMFDRIMLLVQGKLIYQGDRQNIIQYFASFGFKCPDHSNPMDYFMSIMHADDPKNIDQFPNYFAQYEQRVNPQVILEMKDHSTTEIEIKKVETSTLYQIGILAQREITSYKRNDMQMKARIGQAIFQGVLFGGVFWAVAENNGTRADLFSIAGCLFFMCINITFANVMSCILGFAIEREVYLREENSKLYTTGSYFIGKQFVELPLCVICPVIQSLISYWMMKLSDLNPENVPIYLLVAILLSLCTNSMGLMAGCAFKDVKMAINIVPMVLMPLIIYSGFFANSKAFFVWIGWLQWISPIKYAFEAFLINEADGRSYDPKAEVQYDFQLGLWNCIAILAAYFVVYRVLALVFLYRLKARLQ